MANDEKQTAALKEFSDRLSKLEDLIQQIATKIAGASVMNGGFDEIRKEIQDVKATQIRMEYEMKSVRDAEQVFRKRISDITELIYDPDDGLYRRITNATDDDQEADEKLNLVQKKLDHIENTLEPISETNDGLKKIVGSDLSELNSIVKTKKTINALFVVLVTAIVGGLGTFVWGLIEGFWK